MIVRQMFMLLFIFFVYSGASLYASLDSNVPEVPTLFNLLFEHDANAFTQLINQWEPLIFSIMVAIVVGTIFCLGAQYRDHLPKRFQNAIEFVVEAFEKFVVEIIGPSGKEFVPFLGTLFFYILVMNWLAFVPFAKPPTSNLNITVALAICVFGLVQFLSIRNFGIFGYLYHLAGHPKGLLGWLMVPLMFPIELLTQLSRPLTLAFRLFGNVLGEDILIGTFALFGVTLLANWHTPIWLPLQMPFMLFAFFTGIVQALVFTLLSAIYILLSMPSEVEDEIIPD